MAWSRSRKQVNTRVDSFGASPIAATSSKRATTLTAQTALARGPDQLVNFERRLTKNQTNADPLIRDQDDQSDRYAKGAQGLVRNLVRTESAVSELWLVHGLAWDQLVTKRQLTSGLTGSQAVMRRGYSARLRGWLHRNAGASAPMRPRKKMRRLFRCFATMEYPARYPSWYP